MEITLDSLLKIIGIKEVSIITLEEEIIRLKEKIKKLEEEKEVMQKTLKKNVEGG